MKGLAWGSTVIHTGWWMVLTDKERREVGREDCDLCKDVEKPETDDDA